MGKCRDCGETIVYANKVEIGGGARRCEACVEALMNAGVPARSSMQRRSVEDIRGKVLAKVREGENVASRIAAATGLHNETVLKYLRQLVGEALVRKSGHGGRTTWEAA